MEPVYELMDLLLAQTYYETICKENVAIVELWRHIEQHREQYPLTTSTPELVAGYRASLRTREDLLEKKTQATRGVLSAGLLWHSWRRAWKRMVP